MTAQVPTTEPSALRVGMTWQWRRTLANYPASVWTLTYWFKQAAASGAKFSIEAAADGDAHAVEVAATITAAYTADDYTWVAVATSGGDAFEVDSGTCKLLPKYNADTALDDRTHAKKMLERVEAALEAISMGAKSYGIGTRSYTSRDIPELTDLRNQYRAEVFAEQLAENARNGKQGSKLTVTL